MRNGQNDEFVHVVLIVPPFFPCEMPSIATGIIKASLEQKNINCRVCYANMLLAKMVGHKQYLKIMSYDMDELIGERIFATSAHDGMEQTILNETYIPNYSKSFYHHLNVFYSEMYNTTKEHLTQAEYSDIEARCKAFIEEIAKEISLLQPNVIGFSSKFQQINSSIMLARALKKILPNTIYVIGGNNCDGVMGEELSSSIEIFDYVFQGEADFEFANFCQNYLNDGILPEEKLIRCKTPLNLDAIPIPDYTEYFEQSILQSNEDVWLTFESSRGCWWGQKKQCKFCGINASNIKFQSKSPDRVVAELHHLQKKHPDVPRFIATDAIVSKTYFKDFFPKLSDSDFKGEIFYEVKANLTYEQLLTMKRAGVSKINPGIESLSTRLLRLMNKGNDAVTNIRLLRDCRELDIIPFWNLLLGIPGDQASDYEEQSQLLPLLQHFFPPALIPITIQRFSPYFENKKTYGLKDIEPVKGYRHAFPKSVDITRIAYYFEARFPSKSREEPEILGSLIQHLIRWHKSWKNNSIPHLRVKRTHGNQRIVEDSRECAKASTQVLDEDEYLLLKQCRPGISPEHIKSNGLIKRLLEPGYLVEVDGKLLSIVCDLSMFKEVEDGTN